MPVQAYWRVAKKIYYQHISGVVVVDDVEEMRVTYATGMKEGQAPWYIFVDVTEIIDIQIAISQAIHLLRKKRQKHNFPRLTVIITKNSLLHFTARVIGGVLNETYHLFESEDEALTFLRGYDPELGALI